SLSCQRRIALPFSPTVHLIWQGGGVFLLISSSAHDHRQQLKPSQSTRRPTAMNKKSCWYTRKTHMQLLVEGRGLHGGSPCSIAYGVDLLWRTQGGTSSLTRGAAPAATTGCSSRTRSRTPTCPGTWSGVRRRPVSRPVGRLP
ncbi:unnamed protein product, partial [Musa hybrid cultivar]